MWKKINGKVELKEKVDIQKLRLIRDNFDEIMALYPSKKNEPFSVKEVEKVYERAVRSLRMKKDCYKVKYSKAHSNTVKDGRFYCDDAIGIQHLKKVIRHTICGEYYHDIDMKNAHPVFFQHLVREHGLLCPELDNYISNRDKILQSFDESVREEAKECFLKILNGGVSHLGDEEFSKFQEEIHPLLEVLAKKYNIYEKDALKGDDKAYNLNGKIVNRVLCKMENECLFNMFQFFSSKGMTPSVLCFDGLQILKSDLKEQDLDLLNECCDYVFEQTKMRIKLAYKPMDRIIDLSGYKTSDEDKLEIIPTDKEICDTYFSMYGKTDFINENGVLMMFNSENCLWEHIERDNLGFSIMNIMTTYFMDKMMNEALALQVKAIFEKTSKSKAVGEMYLKSICYRTSTGLSSKINYVSPHLIPFQNNVYDISTGTIRKRERNDYFSYSIVNSFLEGADTSIVENVIKNYFVYENNNDTDSLKSLKNAIGYGMTGYNHLKCLFFLYGPTGTGKSFLFNMLKSALKLTPGSKSTGLISPVSEKLLINAKQGQIEGEYDAVCDGARIGYLTELPENSELVADRVKRLTGNDEFIYRPFGATERKVNAVITKLFVGTNFLPQYKSKDDATDARMVFFPFNNTSVKYDGIKDESKFREENASLIFTTFCLYAREFYENGKTLLLSETLIKKKNEIRKENDPVFEFFSLYELSENSEIADWQMYQDYCDFCISLGKQCTTKLIFDRNDYFTSRKKIDKCMGHEKRRTRSVYQYKLRIDE